jgi:hypothetical protein
MYLQAHLLNLSVKLAPEDAKAIAQLASVAQAVVGNSIKLEQIKAELRVLPRTSTERCARLRCGAMTPDGGCMKCGMRWARVCARVCK